MSEAALWNQLRTGMVGRWHCQRHEDRHSKGIPDVSYGIGRSADGWLELKYLPAYPVNGDAPWDFKYAHFTAEQRNWLNNRATNGQGRVYLCCRFGERATAIWHWRKLSPMLGTKTWSQIEAKTSAIWWGNHVDFEQLAAVLGSSRTFPLTYGP